ncbi:MAG: SpoIIE family protein phosphatase [Bacillota bacterium]
MKNINALTLAYNQNETEKNSNKSILNIFYYLIISYILGQAVILDSFYVFAFLYLILIVSNKSKFFKIIIYSVMAISLWQSGGVSAFLYLIAAILFQLLIDFNIFSFKEKYTKAILCSVIHFFLFYSYYFYNNLEFYSYILKFTESIIIMLSILFYYQYKKEIRKNRIEELLLLLSISAFFIGVSSLLMAYSSYSLLIIDSLIILLLTTISWYAGLEKGVLYGVIISLILFLTNCIPFICLVKYLIFTLVVGIFSGEKKYFFFLALSLSFLLYSGLSPSYNDFLFTFFSSIFSLIFFLFLSSTFYNKFFSNLILAVDSNEYPLTQSNIIEKEYNNFDELANLFSEMSNSFLSVLPKKNNSIKSKKDNFLYLYKEKICKKCKYKKSCNLDKKRRDKIILDIFNEINKNGFQKDELVKELKFCPEEYINEIKSCYEIIILNSFWKRKTIKKQKIVAKQLKGISRIIKLIGNNSFKDLIKKELDNKIISESFKNDYEIINSKVFKEIKSNNLNIELNLESCCGNEPCKYQIKKAIENKFSTNFRILSKKCGNKLKDRLCEVEYGESGNYYLEIIIKQIPKRLKSGDSYIYKPLANGLDLLALSDGMGIGKKAAKDSQSTIKLLSSLINAGFSRKVAIETVNSILCMRKGEDKFTTLDIMFFNTFNAEIIFNKIGSMFSFIKSGWKVKTIKASSLPVGILENIEITERKATLKEGDFVIMFSDGVVDSLNNIDNKESWLKKLLQNSSFEKAELFADYIIDVIKSKGKIKDDLSIIVFKVCKFDEKRRKITI